MKFRLLFSVDRIFYNVALFTRAWIEIDSRCNHRKCDRVALFTRAWIEIFQNKVLLARIRGRRIIKSSAAYSLNNKRLQQT